MARKRMNKTFIVAKKELREIFSNRMNVGISIVFALFFSIYQVFTMSTMESGQLVVSLDNSLFIMSAAIGFFISYVAVAQVFLREKMNRVIETLLCSPATLRQIWFGKILAITFFAYIISIIASLIIAIGTGFRTQDFIVPDAAIFLHVLIVVPVFILAFTGLMGYLQLLLGIREIRILNLVVFVPVFALIYILGFSQEGNITIWLYTLIVLVVSIIVLIVFAYLTSRLSKERIITTLPD
jgi:ABC-2 type transport system permease protein